MKFLKALQKSGNNPPTAPRSPRPKAAEPDGPMSRLMPDLSQDGELKIGPAAANGDETHITNGVGAQHAVADIVPQAEIGRKAIAFPSVVVQPEYVNPHLVAITDPNSAFTEEYRNLRTNLLQKRKKQKLNTIAVVSVAPSEGKSTTAINLSWLMAQTDGISALVIDGDLRLPSLSRYLGLDSEVGLSDVLDGDVGLLDAVVKLEPSGLHLLPGGRTRSDVAEQMSGSRFANLLDEAGRSFDFVIIDAPPLSVFVDAKVLINQTDGALLVVRSNYTNYKDLDRILEGLPRQRMLGVVLNQAEEMLVRGKYYDYPYYRS